MKRRLLSLFCALALCLGLLPATALADNGTLTYQYYDTVSGQMTEGTYTGEYTTVTSSDTDWGTSGQTTWYVVSGTVANYKRSNITVSGTVNLILTSGKTLTLNGPNISLQNSSAVLNIYGQAGNTGKLSITAGNSSGDAGINLNGGTLNIHGGKVNATGYTNSATRSAPGIDVGGSGTLTVYGGEVTAEAGTYNGAGIRVTSSGTVSIYGGTVTATGASNKSANGYPGAGIGGNGGSSAGETCGTVNIYGGTVTATGGSGGSGASAGIGGGQGGTAGSQGGGGTVSIYGGTVTATGGRSTSNVQAPGIGGAVYSSNRGSSGTFSTGTNGSAVITANGGIQAGTSGCSAIIDNKVYGNVTLPDSQLSSKNLTVTHGATLTISGEKTLSSSITVNDGGTLTVSGTVTNSGTITVESGGTLTGTGTINNTDSGKVTGDTGNVKVTYPSTVEVSSSTSGTAVLGQEVTFTATVTGNDTAGTPTGTVQFKDGDTNLGDAVTLENGVATYTANNGLDVGEHTITVEYIPADGSSYQGSTSSALTFTVVGEVKSISVQTQPTTMTYTTGQALDLTGLEITVSYEGSETYKPVLSWGAEGITASPDNGTVLKASGHNGKAVTITYGGKAATTDALTVSKADQTGFGFTESSITKTYGDESFTVEATGGQSTGDVTYAVTSGGDVISISDNTVTILKAGEATITATKAADGDYNEATATLTVTVNPASQTGFAFTESSITKTYGEGTFTVEAEGGPGTGAVTYTVTEGTGVISIDGSTVTIEKAGTATITATKAADDKYSAATATLTVTVSPLPVVLEWSTPTEFTYDGQEKTVTATIKNVVGSDSVTLTYTDNSKTNKGTYTATAALTGDDADNYTLDGVENASLTWHIAGVSIDGAVVTLTPESSTYTGSEQRPTVTVTLDSQDLDGDTDYEVSYDPAEVKNAGTYTVTVTGTGNYEGTATATFTIQKADPNIGDVTYSGGDLYDSTALSDITLSREHETVSGTLELDAGQTLMAGTHDYKWTFTPADTDNYETVTGTVQLIVLADTLESVSVKSGPTKTEYVYGDFFDTTGLVLEATYASNNKKEISAEEITVETTGPLTCDMTAVTVSYQGMECQVPVTVNKATYSGQPTVTGTIWANTASEVQLPQPPDGATFGDPFYSVGSDTVVRVEITGNTLAYEGGSGITKGQEYEITVPVNGGTNYENYDITVTLIGTDKKVPTGAPTLSTTTITYGQSLSTITLSGSMQDGAETVTGTFTWDAPTTTPDAGSYEAHWTFTPADGNLYVSVSGTTTITVNKATPTGTPKYTAITTSGKTLADAGLTTEGGTFSVPGTVAWELDDTTQVQANTAYTWKFTPDDSDNYNSISGSVTLYTVSSGGGGGGGSSSSNITTETTKNPDGSTTTTVTNKTTGTVTETTTWPDGSKEVIETKKDGTVTTTTTDTAGNQTAVVEKPDGSSQTTVSNKDGSGSVTLVDADGNIISQATLSESAVAAAQEKGEAVALPMPEVPVTTDRETAPTVTVSLPSGTTAKVEIPVENVTPGTVAILVKADGTEEVIKTSLTTETGVAVTLNNGDTVKIVDNSRDFADVPDNYWGAEAVDFAVSRELFAGTSATTFAPDTAMTRAMIVTVLARFESVDTTTGDTWYEAGQQWAMQNGISDGSNMEQGLTREQLATMLYRYAQSKGYDTTQGGMAIREYADFEQISDYAVEAMTWAVNTGLISGTSTTTLSPQGLATRAQVATILMRFIEGMA
ncbi:Ig-like domain repeat protein [Evtepia sp.]|uniref:Ig-like domain repeat protein n=1 Tax=Evtepia sp. TaxID=2773933 RepID=UPI00399055EE